MFCCGQIDHQTFFSSKITRDQFKLDLNLNLDANNARMNDMERQHSSLLEELGEERKARLLLETSYQEEITSLTHRVGRLKQDIDSKLENELNGRKMEV